MFAVLKTGGKQYRVSSGDILKVEKLAAEAGETVQFDEILMVGDTVGDPFVEGAVVRARVLDQIKDKKVINFVRRRRKHGSKRKKGHRQRLTLLRVTEIIGAGAAESELETATGPGSLSESHALAAPETSEVAMAEGNMVELPAVDATPAPAEDMGRVISSAETVTEPMEREGPPQAETGDIGENPEPSEAENGAQEAEAVATSRPDAAEEQDGRVN